MGFLAPLMLFGGLAASIPLVLHFFYRAHYRPVSWGAMKFLQQAVEQTSRRLRFQEWILLLLRILLMALLAMALARPVSCSKMTAGQRGDAVDAVLVIDTSFSMNVRHGSKTRLEQAKEAALKVIDDLPANSTVQVITCSDRAQAIGPRSPRNLDQARQLVSKIEANQQSTDYLAGLTEAMSALSRAEGAAKEVYLFSDMQRGGWERESSAVRAKCEEIKGQGTLYLVRCGDKQVHNVSILDLKPQADIPHTGSRLPFTVLVKNTGTETVSGLTVTLNVDGQPLDKDAQPIDQIAPGETVPVTLTGKIEEAGWRVLTAEVKSDQLEDDNRFNRIFLIREKVRVLIIDGTPNDRDPERSGSFFLAHALLPIPEEFRFQYHVLPTIVRAADAGPGLLADKEICILANVPIGGPGALQEDFVQALPEFVRTGHGLLITSGNNVEPEVYNRLLGGERGILPLPLTEVKSAPQGEVIFPDPKSVEPQSFLARLKRTGSDPLQLLRDTSILKFVGVNEEAPSSRVLMRYNSGQPAILGKTLGEGDVLFLTTAVDKEWGEFASSNPVFVPLMHAAMTHLLEHSSTGFNRVSGEAIRYVPKDLRQSYQVQRPDGQVVRLGPPQGGATEQLALTVADTSQAGIYTIAIEGSESGTRFAVLPDLRESETLEPLPDQQIDELLGFKAEHVSAGASTSQQTESIRSRNEWTAVALGCLLALAAIEAVFAWFCGKAW
jgi:hypothetical protein